MGRIRRGWELTKKSWGVLRANRSLIRFPLFGGVAAIALTIIVMGPGLYLIDDGEIAPGAPLVVLGVLENQGGVFGAVVSRVLDIGWTLVTFLAVPVIAIEGTSAFATMRRSGSIFKERWGQQIAGNLAIGGAVFLLGMLPAILLVVAGVALWSTSGFGGAILVVIGVVIFTIAALISQALSGIFGVALYRYATEGEALGGFTPAELDSAVKRKGGPAPVPA